MPDDGAAVARSIGMYLASETVAIRERIEGAIRLLTYAHRMSGANPEGLPMLDALSLAQLSTSEAAKHARWWLDGQILALRSPTPISDAFRRHDDACTACGHDPKTENDP